MTDCYEFLQGQGEKMLSKIVIAKRLIDEKVSHAVVYAYRDQLLIDSSSNSTDSTKCLM